MIGVVFTNLVVVVCSFWVFVDAANNKIGVHTIQDGINKGQKNGFSPVVWGVGAFFIIPFFIYLFRRKTLLLLAKENPVETDKSKGFIILFLIISGLLMFSFRDILFV